MPYVGIGSISGIIHFIARFPHAARGPRGRRSVDRHLALNKGDRGRHLNCSTLGNRALVCLYARCRFLDAEWHVR
jgi:hypothetical protein